METNPLHNGSFSKSFSVFTDKIGISTKLPGKVLIACILIGLIVLMFPHGESREFQYSVGAVWVEKDLIAPFSFPIYKEKQQYENEKAEAVRSVYPVYQRDERALSFVTDTLHSMVNTLQSAVRAKLNMIRNRSDEDSILFTGLIRQLPFAIAEKDWAIIAKWSESGVVEKRIRESIAEVLNEGVLDQNQVPQSHRFFALRKGMAEDIIPVAKVYALSEAHLTLETKISSLFADDAERRVAILVARHALVPNLILNRPETQRLVQVAEENVPRTLGFVKENERVVSRHDRITEEVKLKLDSFQRAKGEREIGTNEWEHWVGILLHVMVILSLYAIYIFLFRKKIYDDNGKLIIIALLLLFEAFLAYLSLQLDVAQPIHYLIAVPTASMLLVIIFDSRVAFYGTVITAFLIAGIRGNDYDIALMSLVAGAFGAYTVRDIRSRTQIFRSMIFIFIGYAVSILALSFEQFGSATTVFTHLTFALINAIVSPLITYALLILFERVFNVATDLRLIELSDFNQPLLKELSEKAPGTFHHSMLLGNLAEAAAESIGANPILAKAGAYYHDIGKINKPEYFVENQIGTHSKHARLRPRMSALIIASHVKEGIEIARNGKLPEKIIDFIPQHHGTTRIAFFYDKAIKQAERKGTGETIQEDDFQYPGPKPQLKETGIVMLADSVEASTRAMHTVTPQELEDAIEGMIKQRFSEGQLDECDLTLRDLTRIKESFLKILVGIHHQRILYPEQQEEASEKQPVNRSTSSDNPIEQKVELSDNASPTAVDPGPQ